MIMPASVSIIASQVGSKRNLNCDHHVAPARIFKQSRHERGENLANNYQENVISPVNVFI